MLVTDISCCLTSYCEIPDLKLLFYWFLQFFGLKRAHLAGSLTGLPWDISLAAGPGEPNMTQMALVVVWVLSCALGFFPLGLSMCLGCKRKCSKYAKAEAANCFKAWPQKLHCHFHCILLVKTGHREGL